MADKLSQLILAALSRAAAGGETPLYSSKTAPGLFPTTALGKQAALRCQDEGYLGLTGEEATNGSAASNGTVGTAVKKKAAPPSCRITPRGMTYLLSQVSPRQVLEDLVRVLEARQEQMADLMQATCRMQRSLEEIKSQAATVLKQAEQAEAGFVGDTGTVGGLKALFSSFRKEQAESPPPASTIPPGDLGARILAELEQWQAAGSSEDCSLPYLFHRLQSSQPDLTIGQLHDALRRLQDTEKVYLHPWTGPLYDIPEPPYAVLTGHEIAYYASCRGS